MLCLFTLNLKLEKGHCSAIRCPQNLGHWGPWEKLLVKELSVRNVEISGDQKTDSYFR